MNTTITATWITTRSPETKVTFQAGYKKLSRIEKLDFLQDTIGDLIEIYNKTLSDFHNRGNDEQQTGE